MSGPAASDGGPSTRSKTFPTTMPSRSQTSPLLPDGYYSPLRHHKRAQSLGPREVKETLDACLQYGDDDTGQDMRINQYTLKQEIGRGSYGAVHLAVDQTGQQFAAKEFSKSRLRKQSQFNMLRKLHTARGRSSRGSRLPSSPQRQLGSQTDNEEEAKSPLYLIREEIAIMKKLDHENIVKLYEVLDNPDGDSLYMVMEYCAKGVVMKVGLGEKAQAYPEDQCRFWFRDMILGIEYLHSQKIIHRDIKPDNLILTEDDCLKIVDFGVSELFKKGTQMYTAKSAGSPAFLPPELCRVGHGDISGEAADIWSMGITLYCLCFGCLPFNYTGVLELYEAIRYDTPDIPTDNLDLKDLLLRLLDKDPSTRIRMPELREHPWVTCRGDDTLLSFEENTKEFLVPTEEEVNSAITKSIRNVMIIVKAVNKLKSLRARKAERRKAIASISEVPASTELPNPDPQGVDDDCTNTHATVTTGVHSATETEKPVASPPKRMDSAVALEDTKDCTEDSDKNEGGHALPLPNESITFLNIGVDGADGRKQEEFVVSESPTMTPEHIYEEAYGKVIGLNEATSEPISNLVLE